MNRRELKKHWREEMKISLIAPTWPGLRLHADYPIDDHAFIAADPYTPATHQAIVVTQHAPRTRAEPQAHLLIAAAVKYHDKRTPKAKAKTVTPDPSWLTPGRIGPQMKIAPVDWTRFQKTHVGADTYMCKDCRTLIHGDWLDSGPRAQVCPHTRRR